MKKPIKIPVKEQSKTKLRGNRKHPNKTRDKLENIYGLQDYRHIMFVKELLADKAMNVSQAAIKAGYTGQTGTELLKRKDIAAAVAKSIKQRTWRHEVDAERVLTELLSLGYSNLQNYYDENGDPIPLHKLSPEAARAIKYIDANGNPVFWDKVAALGLLAKHVGILEQVLNVSVAHTLDLDSLYGREEKEDIIETTINDPRIVEGPEKKNQHLKEVVEKASKLLSLNPPEEPVSDD